MVWQARISRRQNREAVDRRRDRSRDSGPSGRFIAEYCKGEIKREEQGEIDSEFPF
jgi:hypothetical protein